MDIEYNWKDLLSVMTDMENVIKYFKTYEYLNLKKKVMQNPKTLPLIRKN